MFSKDVCIGLVLRGACRWGRWGSKPQHKRAAMRPVCSRSLTIGCRIFQLGHVPQHFRIFWALNLFTAKDSLISRAISGRSRLAQAFLLYLRVYGRVSMSILDVVFERVDEPRSRVLKEVFDSGAAQPGVLATMGYLEERLDVLITRPGGVVERERLTVRGAGASRIVYISSGAKLAFKLADISNYSDDNKDEFDAPVPAWLVPHVHGYFQNKSVIAAGTELLVSVLIVDEMDFTLQDLGKTVPDASAMDTARQDYAEAIAAAWGLLARAGKETNCAFGDWSIANLMVARRCGAVDVRLVDWAGTNISEGSPYQRVKRAKNTLLRDLSCIRDANSSGAAWFDGLELFKNICHRWWPAGLFNNVDGVPTVEDVKGLRKDLLLGVEHLRNISSATPPASSAPLASTVLPEPSAPPAAPAIVMDANHAEPQNQSEKRHRTTTVKPVEAGMAVSPWGQAILKSLDIRSGLREGDVASLDVENFMYDFPPKSTAEQSLRASAIADEFRTAAATESRLIVTAARGEFEGHISLRERVHSGKLPRLPTISALLGDDLMLFIRLLLALMPLHRIALVWSPKEQKYWLPNSASAMKFHRSYWPKLAEHLGARSELWRWRDTFIAFLTTMIPEGSPNQFKWGGFWMTPREIADAVTEATYQYGMERMGCT